MIVYGDILILENAVIGAVIIEMTAMVNGVSINNRRKIASLIIGSIMCGIYSLVVFLGLRSISLFFSEVVFAVALTKLTLGAEDTKELISRSICFILVTYFTGGLVMGILMITRNEAIVSGIGIYTADMKAGLLSILIGISFFTVRQICITFRKRKFFSEHVYDVEIAMGDRLIKTKGYVDTGNHLKEPLSNKPVAVVSSRIWSKTLPVENFRFALIPYETVGNKGIMEAQRADYIKIGDKKIKGCVISKSDKPIKWDVLLSAQMLGQKSISDSVK